MAGEQHQTQRPEARIAARIAAAPADREAWQVFADWLLTRGDPRGELIAAGLAEPTAPTRPLAPALLDQFAGPELAALRRELGDEVLGLRWRWGFIVAAELRGSALLDDSLADLLAVVLNSPAARFLQALALCWVSLRSRDTVHIPIADLVTAGASGAGPLASLRALELGAPAIRERSLAELELGFAGTPNPGGGWPETAGPVQPTRVLIGDLSRLWAVVPRLEWLELRGRKIKLGELRHGRLRVLRLGSDQLSASTLAELGAAALPALDELSVDFGRLHRSRAGELELLAPIFAGRTAPRLSRLRLRSTEFGAGLIDALLASPLLERLRILDLEGGDLADDAAELLLRGVDRLAALERLRLAGTLISTRRCLALRARLGERVDFGRRPLA